MPCQFPGWDQANGWRRFRMLLRAAGLVEQRLVLQRRDVLRGRCESVGCSRRFGRCQGSRRSRSTLRGCPFAQVEVPRGPGNGRAIVGEDLFKPGDCRLGFSVVAYGFMGCSVCLDPCSLRLFGFLVEPREVGVGDLGSLDLFFGGFEETVAGSTSTESQVTPRMLRRASLRVCSALRSALAMRSSETRFPRRSSISSMRVCRLSMTCWLLKPIKGRLWPPCAPRCPRRVWPLRVTRAMLSPTSSVTSWTRRWLASRSSCWCSQPAHRLERLTTRVSARVPGLAS